MDQSANFHCGICQGSAERIAKAIAHRHLDAVTKHEFVSLIVDIITFAIGKGGVTQPDCWRAMIRQLPIETAIALLQSFRDETGIGRDWHFSTPVRSPKQMYEYVTYRRTVLDPMLLRFHELLQERVRLSSEHKA